MNPTAYGAGLAAGAGLIVAIGAQNAFVLRQGLRRQYVGPVVLICIVADAVLILAGVSGMGLAIKQLPGLAAWLRYAGSAFLAIYGLLAARRAWQGESGLRPAEQGVASLGRVLLTCLAFTLLNPHVYLDTVVLLGSLSTRYADGGNWSFGWGACTASLLWFCALGFGARLLLPWFRAAAAWRVLDGLIALLMLALSAVLLLQPLS